MNKTNPNDYAKVLTKREHFAAIAMQALCSQEGTWNSQPNHKIAQSAVAMADALIEQLNKQAEQ